MMESVRLKGLKFYAYHGYYEEERKLGSHYTIHLEVFLQPGKRDQGDELGYTLDYQGLASICEDEMGQPRKLLESLAWSITKKIFEDYSQAHKVEIEVLKHQPPLKILCESTSFRLQLERSELQK